MNKVSLKVRGQNNGKFTVFWRPSDAGECHVSDGHHWFSCEEYKVRKSTKVVNISEDVLRESFARSRMSPQEVAKTNAADDYAGRRYQQSVGGRW